MLEVIIDIMLYYSIAHIITETIEALGVSEEKLWFALVIATIISVCRIVAHIKKAT